MKIKEKLQLLLGYYCATRGVGHTEKMLSGAKSGESLIVVSNVSQGMLIIRNQLLTTRDFITLDNLRALQGRRKPLLFDNGAMTDILRDSANEIDRLERENAELRSKPRHGPISLRLQEPLPVGEPLPLREPLPLGENESDYLRPSNPRPANPPRPARRIDVG